MVPAAGGKPVPPRLLNQLALTLRALEGARQVGADEGASVAQALEDLGVLGELVADVGPGTLPDGVPGELEKAREALDASDVDEARSVLVGVGRSIDDHLRG